jgi:DNA-binding NtrC family response regulator
VSAPVRLLESARARHSAAAAGEFVGRHPAMVQLLDLIRRAAKLETPVLIQGPTGAGKELVAERLHACSGRIGRLVALNVASLPDALAESELFGSSRGAFTDAKQDRTGLIEEAAEGTLFLDEAAELSTALQTKLLRVLETGAVRPLGGTRDRRVSFRLVLSTQQPVGILVKDGRWRADFYYRVAGISLDVPALAEHASDIPLLLDHFLGLLGHPPLGLEEAGALAGYPWHGNVRELRRAVERAAFVAGERAVTMEDIHDAVAALQVPGRSNGSERRSQPGSLRDLQRDHITSVLQQTAGNTMAAAAILGLSRSQVYRRMQELGIRPATQR